MEQHPDNNNYLQALAEQDREVVTSEQISDIAAGTQKYLTSLYKKAGIVEEESNRPILTPDEHSYINRAISAAAHLGRYWLEMPSVKMPSPDKLTGIVEVLRKTGTKLESTTEDILKDEDLFKGLLGRTASRQQHTSRLNVHENRGALTCANELIEFIKLMAASNQDQLPFDYSVGISLNEIANHPEGPEFEKLPPNIEGLKHLLDGLEPDSFGFIRLDEARRLKLETILRDWGAAVQSPGPQEIQNGIESARNLVKQGRAGEYLESLAIIQREDIPKQDRFVAVELKYPIYINPESILGTNKITNWAGRGQHDRNDDLGDKKPFLDIVIDYATRGTRLPTTEARIFIQENGELIIFTENERTTAAAKLRSEPLAVNALHLYK